MPEAALSPFHALFHLILTSTYGAGTKIIPILHVRKVILKLEQALKMTSTWFLG